MSDFKFHLRGEQSNGRLGVVESTVAAGWPGPPLHVHPAFDEGFYVLEGELTVQVEGELHTVRAGEFVYADGATPHCIANRSDARARYLIMITPPGFEKYFMRLAAEIDGVEPPPDAKAYESGTRVLGPRIGEA
jgi:quercetin dioxygenase-like cupin family protein